MRELKLHTLRKAFSEQREPADSAFGEDASFCVEMCSKGFLLFFDFLVLKKELPEGHFLEAWAVLGGSFCCCSTST